MKQIPPMTSKQFNSVLALVEGGLAIVKACKAVGIKSSLLYRDMTPEQKLTLNMAKVQHAQYKSGNAYTVKGR